MYKIIAILSYLIRNAYLPNPFEQLGDGLHMMINGVEILFTPDMLELMFDGVLHGFTFVIVGLFYKRNSLPVLGSMLYFLFYCIHIVLIYGMCNGEISVIWLIIYLITLCYLLGLKRSDSL